MIKTLLQITCLLLVFLAGNLLPSIRLILPNQQLEVDENPRNVQFLNGRHVCVCNEEKCDDIKFSWPEKAGEAVLVETTATGKRWQASKLSSFSDTDQVEITALDVDLNVEYQEILGWGGSFTGAFGFNLQDLSPKLAEKLIESYFGEDGLGYNFGRVPIGCADFSTKFYTNDETNEPDYDLKQWKLKHEDLMYKIPPIKLALKLAEKRGYKLNLIASPWSAPLWMKDNHDRFFGKLIDDDRVFKAYAMYLIKFLEAYKEKGIDFYGMTFQNEPITPVVLKHYKSIVSMEFSVENSIRLINEHLGPALVERNLTKDNFKLLIGDENFGLQNDFVKEILKNDTAVDYIGGVAFHDYESAKFGYDALTEMYDFMKNKTNLMIMTEFSTGVKDVGRVRGTWTRAEDYATDIIQVMERNTSAYIDWNLALNTKGGPSWSGNSVDSPIIVDKEKNSFYKQNLYYGIAHFSRLMQPGSIRVESILDDVGKVHPDTKRVGHSIAALSAVTQSKQHLVVNIVNRNDSNKFIDLKVKKKLGGFFQPGIVKLEGRSINSIVIKL